MSNASADWFFDNVATFRVRLIFSFLGRLSEGVFCAYAALHLFSWPMACVFLVVIALSHLAMGAPAHLERFYAKKTRRAY